MWGKQDLKLINTKRAIYHLMKMENPDFEQALEQVKYTKKLEGLQIEMVKLQNWIVENNQRLIVIFEGREFSGKGGTIRALTEHLNPRNMRIVALPKPSETEQGQWYFQRYIMKLPSPGEMVFFDRSWYNRAMVEPVNGFCTKEEYERFMKEVNDFERMISNDGIKIVKFYLSITKTMQRNRIKAVKNNPLRRWELTKVDERAIELWATYTKYKQRMLKKTHTNVSPWKVIDSNNKLQASLDTIRFLLKQIPYKSSPKD